MSDGALLGQCGDKLAPVATLRARGMKGACTNVDFERPGIE
jgi:hypothetical protein